MVAIHDPPGDAFCDAQTGKVLCVQAISGSIQFKRFNKGTKRSARTPERITGARAALPQNCPRSEFMRSFP
jgi:hypothetical protein